MMLQAALFCFCVMTVLRFAEASKVVGIQCSEERT